ncbi:hypothetical protein QAD02_018929 [Eretmocerus hayati]|uniref:Uncharacterized protein n=1 Tax=Eretmocerus hayati TaxID=131215 RepID=A0ACC2PIE2_9HYME|nr:hypothetical protein QAD02_018929 [Eretmocerus hayati]
MVLEFPSQTHKKNILLINAACRQVSSKTIPTFFFTPELKFHTQIDKTCFANDLTLLKLQIAILFSVAILAKGAIVAPVTTVVATQPAVISHQVAVPAVSAKLEEYDPHPRYTFAYDVQDASTGDSKAQFETRDGDVVKEAIPSSKLTEAEGLSITLPIPLTVQQAQEQPQQQPRVAVARAVATPLAPLPVTQYVQRIVAAPAPATVTLGYQTYSSAYSSPFAYNLPFNRLGYTVL